ncbi:MAG: glycosyltransferase family 4 protein [Bacteroidota bacterium]|nr:glycosyltransferase family 4 protein [Bacteroidota bacterium]
MRIGLVLPEVPQYSETFFNYKIKSLQDSGFEVIVFSNKETKEKHSFKISAAYPVYSGKKVKQFFLFTWIILFTFLSSPSRAIKLFTLERKDGHSIYKSLKSVYINAHILKYKLDWLHFGFTTMALKRENAAKAIGAKMGVSFRGYDINIYPLKHPGSYKKIWENVDKIHSISDYLYAKAITLGLSKEKPFAKITPAIDISLFKLKNDLGKMHTPLRILTVGRLNWIKDYETSVSAMKILKTQGIDFVYKIAGDGKDMERLKFAVYQSGLEENIVFTGRVSHSQINTLMNESDIYLQTSLQEGFCVSVLEAQSAGLLCVASDAEGLKENIADGSTGWIVKRRDPQAFANKIVEIISLPDEKRKAISLNARERVEQDFNTEAQKTKFRSFFTE